MATRQFLNIGIYMHLRNRTRQRESSVIFPKF